VVKPQGHESPTLAKAYGIIMCCYWEQLEEHIGNNEKQKNPSSYSKEKHQTLLSAC